MVYEYKGNDYEGVTIVGFGLALNVTNGAATVEYNGLTDKYDVVLQSGTIKGRLEGFVLDNFQMAWLEENGPWVKRKIEESD